MVTALSLLACTRTIQKPIPVGREKSVIQKPAPVRRAKPRIVECVIRHTLTEQEARAGVFTLAWNKALVEKIVLMTADLTTRGGKHLNNLMSIRYDGARLTVTKGANPWTTGEVVIIYVIYEKPEQPFKGVLT